MAFEIYAQPIEVHEGAIGINVKKRYFTEDKKKAFNYMNYLNNIEQDKNVVWRIAMQVKNRIVFDIDNEDINNSKLIIDYYSKLFNKKLKLFKSNSGFHIYGEPYTNEWEWHLDSCRVLNPLLESMYLLRYLNGLKRWYQMEVQKEVELGWNRTQFVKNIKPDFINSSGLYSGIGDFDILFSIMVLFKGYYCIRITKKSESENLQEVLL